VLPKVPSESSSKLMDADQCISKPLRALPNVGGFSVVFMPCASSSFVFRTSVSLPHVINFRAGFVGSLCGFDSIGCQNGFIYLDDHVSFIIPIFCLKWYLLRRIGRILLEHASFLTILILITLGRSGGSH